MGLQKDKSLRKFGIRDLGVLDAVPPRGLRTLVELCAASTNAPVAALFIFDDAAAELFLSTSFGLSGYSHQSLGLPLTGSVASHVRANQGVSRIKDLRKPPFDTSVEHLRFNVRSYLGALVLGPAGEPLGVLAAMHRTAYDWTFNESKLVGDAAYLISQQIMLKASFETLKIISAEQRSDPI